MGHPAGGPVLHFADMTTLHRTIRVLGAGLMLLALAMVAFLFVASNMLERALRTQRTLGNWEVMVHGPSVSPLFMVRADSIVLRSADARLDIVRPFGRFAGMSGFRASGVTLVLRADSIGVEMSESHEAPDEPVPFPAALRFPLGLILEWRVMTVRLPGMPEMVAGAARWQSRGSQALNGTFRLSFPGLRAGNQVPALEAEMDARWRGPALRYRLEASHGAEGSLLLSGIREKRDLRAGFDSVNLFVDRPDQWFSVKAENLASRAPILSKLRLAGKADWRRDSLRFTASLVTAASPPLESVAWGTPPTAS
jgi:hypothetical protein